MKKFLIILLTLMIGISSAFAVVQIQIRRDTASNWTSVNPTLASGEMGVETDTDKFKFGDGATPWSSLSYVTGTGTGTVTGLTISGTQGMTVSASTTTTIPNISVGMGSITPTHVTSGASTFSGLMTVSGGMTVTGDSTVTGTIHGNATTATALAALGTSCSAGQYARGIDVNGNATGCTADQTGGGGSISGLTAGKLTVATSSTTISDSLVTQAGAGLTIAGNTTVNNLMAISGGMTVSQDATFTGGIILGGVKNTTWPGGSQTPWTSNINAASYSLTGVNTITAGGMTVSGGATFSGTGDSYLNSTSGNVGIGTTSPTQKLSVSGSVTISSDLYCGTAKSTTGYRTLCIDSTGKIFSVSAPTTCGSGT